MNQAKVLLVLFIFIICCSISFALGFNDIYSANGSHVIAVGNNGNIFMSYDGGVTFGSYPQGSTTYNSVQAINQKVWIAGNSGTVLYSTNAGNSYTSILYTANNLNSVHFIDENTGWLAGNSGTIAKSTNGGINWIAQTSPGLANLNDIKFTGSANGYACGDNGTVIYTTNGGNIWLQYLIEDSFTKNLLSIDVRGTTIIASAVDGIIIKYNGSNWSIIDYKILTKTDVRSISMIDENTFYTCGGGGFINKTTNGGMSRTYQANPMVAPLKTIYMYNESTGWAVSSSNNAVLRTQNGGNTWGFQDSVSVNYSFTLKQSTSGNIGNPFCLHPKNKNGVFILAGSSLYRSLDKGETWTLLQSSIPGSSCHSFYVNALDTNLMIASKGSGGAGRIIKSTDYGITWIDVINPINLTSYGMPMEVDPNNPNTVYLAPDGAPVRKSTDWGTTWTMLGGGIGGNFASPCDVVIPYENPNVVFVADGSSPAKFWKSTNGGLNWTLINSVTGAEIPMVANSTLDLNLVYHTSWPSGNFWKSTNMGSNFTDLLQGGYQWACDVAKDDPTAVTYDWYSSTCYISLDGGSNFTTAINVGSAPAAGVVWMDKSTLLYQHGAGIHKLNVTYTVTPLLSSQQTSLEIPSEFSLGQNYPNPFNPNTLINYGISKPSFITIKLFDVTGREIKTLINSQLAPGNYKIDFDASSLSGGVYFYTMLANGNKIDSRKMILLK
ncbi:MAG TPA: YCF48-related protein [Ignavibacteria bacterium]|jgi:photosystem II stability/assembly factor-like uncharacterized protein